MHLRLGLGTKVIIECQPHGVAERARFLVEAVSKGIRRIPVSRFHIRVVPVAAPSRQPCFPAELNGSLRLRLLDGARTESHSSPLCRSRSTAKVVTRVNNPNRIG